MSESPADRERQLSMDRDTIETWADDHDAVPVRDPEADHLRLVPESDVTSAHERLDWDAFFDEFEEDDYVAIYHEEGAMEPLEVVKRSEAVTRSSIGADEFEERLVAGETVTTEIRETTVVESVIVEELTVESELIDTETVDERVIDAELVGRECTNCAFVDDREVDHRELFDEDGYFGTLGTTMAGSEQPMAESETTRDDPETMGERSTGEFESGEFPYHAELDVAGTWTVTRELLERFTVESRITGTEVTEADTIEDHDVDVEGLHQSIVESGVIDVEESPDEVLTHYDIESELAEEDRIHSYFDRERLVEDEVLDRKRLRADVTGSEPVEMELLTSRDLAMEEPAEQPAEPVAEEVTLTSDEVGKDVVDATGQNVGRITAVEEDRNVMRIDPHHSITERVMAALGWGEEDDDYPLRAEHVDRVTDDRVVLKDRDELTRRE